jgi:hypothetical protein
MTGEPRVTFYDAPARPTLTVDRAWFFDVMCDLIAYMEADRKLSRDAVLNYQLHHKREDLAALQREPPP